MKIGRNAKTGRFEKVSTAQRDKKGAIVQTIKRSSSPKKTKK